MSDFHFSTITADPDVEIIEEVIVDDSEDSLWKIIAHDDDRTTMEFVVRLMLQVFKKPLIFAEGIMWQVHNDGMAVVDALPKKDAETRVRIATLMARMEGFPFRLTIEPDD